jgi:hypothetical protein
MPPPHRGEAGPSFHRGEPILRAASNAIQPNIPLAMRGHPNQPSMNRQQRRAHERKLRTQSSRKVH